MKTQLEVLKEERIDDVPLLIGMMRRLKIAEVVDKHLPPHHLHQGVSYGTLVVGWLAFILSQADHRKSAVQNWAQGLEHSLPVLLGQILRPVEFSDDRLGIVLNRLADCNWEDLEGDLFHCCFEVYELPTDCVRHDSTTSYGYHASSEDGIMQLGHSKDHRPDLPQFKLMAAVTGPLAFPLSTDALAGNTPDDGLYWPSIQRVQKLLDKKGLLHVGDNKMAALDTRARVAQSGDFYLMPLPNTGQTAKLMSSWVETALAQPELLTEIYRPAEPGSDEPPELLARGYEFTRTLAAQVGEETVTWTERVQVLQSLSLLDSQKKRLEKDLQQAEGELHKLTLAGKGRRVWRDEVELKEAVEAIVQKHGVAELLKVSWQAEQIQKKRHAGRGRPSKDAAVTVEVETRYRISEVKRVQEKIDSRQERLGWRAQVSNAPSERLTLQGSVLTYREGGSQERVFHQVKDKPLGIRPLFVKKERQIIGLTRLLLVALRVLTMVEIVVRSELEKKGEKLQGLYEGQASREEGKPTASRLLKAIARLGITLMWVSVAGEQQWAMRALPGLLVRVLEALELPTEIYTDLVRPDLVAASTPGGPPILLTG
jgi:transposase